MSALRVGILDASPPLDSNSSQKHATSYLGNRGAVVRICRYVLYDGAKHLPHHLGDHWKRRIHSVSSIAVHFNIYQNIMRNVRSAGHYNDTIKTLGFALALPAPSKTGNT